MRRYTKELFAALARVPELTVIAVGPRAGSQVPKGVEIAAGSLSLPTNLGWMLTGLPVAARRARLDVFHAPSYTAPVYGPRPLVLTIHDVSYERHPEWYPYSRDPLRRAFYRASAEGADRIITDSAFSKSEILAAYDLRPESVHVVPLAASTVFSPGPPMPLPPGCPAEYVLHVGDLHERRNLPMLARAVAAARAKRGTALTLVCVGTDRGSGQALRAIGHRVGGSPLVLPYENATESTLLALYRSAAALVYPSRYEGFGLPLLEAMSCGTPVIASRSSSIPEVVGEAAVLLDPDDEPGWAAAIERVLDDPSHASQLRTAGLSRAAGFSWDRTAAETAVVYRRLVSKPAS